MKQKNIVNSIIALFVISLFVISGVQAKANDAPVIQQLYINHVSFEDTPRKIILYKELLPERAITIKGKVKNFTGSGLVKISTDGKEKWQNILPAADGAFSYRFTVEKNVTYYLYIGFATEAGSEPKVLQSKMVQISDQSLRSAVTEALDGLLTAYRQKNARLFMSYISPDFRGDDILLARAIRRDFMSIDNYDMHYTISSLAIGDKGRIDMVVYYSGTITPSRPDPTLIERYARIRGTTQISWKVGTGGPKVYSIKIPVLFGFSDAKEISSGILRVAGSNTLIINRNGSAKKGDVNQAAGNDSIGHYPHDY